MNEQFKMGYFLMVFDEWCNDYFDDSVGMVTGGDTIGADDCVYISDEDAR